MSLEKAAREYLEFMTSKKGLSWVDYLGESARLETQLREALESLPNKACTGLAPTVTPESNVISGASQ